MVAAAGGASAVHSQVPLGARGLHWSPSGKALQYRLTRNGASNIWEQPLTGGAAPAAHEIHLRPDLRLCLVARRQAVCPGQGQPDQRRNPDQQLQIVANVGASVPLVQRVKLAPRVDLAEKRICREIDKTRAAGCFAPARAGRSRPHSSTGMCCRRRSFHPGSRAETTACAGRSFRG